MTWPIVDGVSLMHLHISRGKRSLVLDLRTDEGVATYLDLVRGADAVVRSDDMAHRRRRVIDAPPHQPRQAQPGPRPAYRRGRGHLSRSGPRCGRGGPIG